MGGQENPTHQIQKVQIRDTHTLIANWIKIFQPQRKEKEKKKKKKGKKYWNSSE